MSNSLVGLDVQIADLILRSQGNFRELEELAEMLDDCLNSCELNLKSSQIIPDDGNPKPATATLTDLPVQEQTVVFGTALFSSMALTKLARLTGVNPVDLAAVISKQVELEMSEMSDEHIAASLKDILEKYRKNSAEPIYTINIPTDI